MIPLNLFLISSLLLLFIHFPFFLYSFFSAVKKETEIRVSTKNRLLMCSEKSLESSAKYNNYNVNEPPLDYLTIKAIVHFLLISAGAAITECAVKEEEHQQSNIIGNPWLLVNSFQSFLS